MATFIVTTANDVVAGDGLRSLREAVSSANATPEADVIRFAPALEGHTLTLTQGELRLTRDVTIDGDADNNGSRVEISGGWSGNLDERDGSGILNLVGAGFLAVYSVVLGAWATVALNAVWALIALAALVRLRSAAPDEA